MWYAEQYLTQLSARIDVGVAGVGFGTFYYIHTYL